MSSIRTPAWRPNNDADERRDDAVRLAQTAQRAPGDLPSALATLGWMYYLKDSHDLAVTYLEKAATASPSNAVIALTSVPR